MALRVLAVAQAAELGGAERALLRVVPHLAREDIELEVAVPAEGGVAAAAREQGLEVHRLAFGPLRRGGWPRAVLDWPRTRVLVRKVKPDVVWLNGIVPQRLVPALGSAPALLHLHDLVHHEPRPWHSKRFWQRVPLVACASQAVADLAEAGGAPRDRLRVVPVPVLTADPAPRPEWADQRPVVGFVGRIEPRKGVLDLLSAAFELKLPWPNVRVVIVRGPDIDLDRDYEQRVLAAARGLEDTVTIVGPVPDAAALMHWFDVLCVPSWEEPFGTVAAEALATGTPAVVTDSGGMPEYVVPGVNGDVVIPGVPEQMAQALDRTLTHAHDMAEAARASVKPFATDRVAAQLAGLLRETATA